MANPIYDGGAAFPRPASEDRQHGDQPDGNQTVCEQEGMSIRDYFAAQALTGLIAANAGRQVLPQSEVAAELAYGYADAMLRHRQGG